MSKEKNIDDFLDQLMQTKISLRHLIEDYQEIINKSNWNPPYKTKHNQAIFFLRNKYEMLDLIQTEIRYLTRDIVQEGMSK